nr:MAG TPA: hypothetical protein [Bacteriophage sp.]
MFFNSKLIISPTLHLSSKIKDIQEYTHRIPIYPQ